MPEGSILSMRSVCKVHFRKLRGPITPARGDVSMVKRSAGELLFAISVDRTSRKSVTAQVYGGVKQLILSGDLAAGKRLPSSRTLANELKISRTTAIAVFERLTSEGLIKARTGSGSFVAESASQHRSPMPLVVRNERPATTKLADLITEASPKFFQRLAHPSKPRAFITGLPDYKAFPMAVWSRLSAKHWREPREFGHGLRRSDRHRAAAPGDRRPSARQVVALRATPSRSSLSMARNRPST